MSNNRDYSNAFLTHRVADLELLDVVIENLELNRDMRLLDFGCGTGNYLLALQEKGYTKLFALDVDDSMIDIASKRTGIAVQNGSHLSIPFENNFFDSIILIAMIHFIDDLSSLFKNLNRVCMDRGRIVIVTQSHKQVSSRFYNKYFPSLVNIDKERYHEPQYIISIAQKNGFVLKGVQDYATGKDMVIDDKYFELIKSKSFYVLRMLSDAEFEEGMKNFTKDLEKAGGNFVAPFAGWTIITLQKEDTL